MDILFPLVAIAGLIGIHWYFQSRGSLAPSRIEKVLAIAWLCVRRLVCFSAALLCIGGSLYLLYGFVVAAFSAMALVGSVLLLALGCIGFHYGMYGAGHRSSDVREDRPVHEKRKQRYGWRL